MSDLFHEDVPMDFIQYVFAVMDKAHWHTFQILTKRSARLKYVADMLQWPPNVWMAIDRLPLCGIGWVIVGGESGPMRSGWRAVLPEADRRRAKQAGRRQGRARRAVVAGDASMKKNLFRYDAEEAMALVLSHEAVITDLRDANWLDCVVYPPCGKCVLCRARALLDEHGE